MNVVVRVADTVRRPPAAAAEFVRDLLRFLEQCGWAGAPRYLGLDDQGREVLGFIEGHVVWEKEQPADVRSEESLVAIAQLSTGTSQRLARVHDVAHVCWQYLDLGPRVTDVADTARLVRVIADAYDLSDRAGLVEAILWWQDRCWAWD